MTAAKQLPLHTHKNLRRKPRIYSSSSTVTVLVKTYVGFGEFPFVFLLSFPAMRNVLRPKSHCIWQYVVFLLMIRASSCSFYHYLFWLVVAHMYDYILSQIHCLDVVLEDTDTVKALTEFISYAAIENCVLGASRHGFIR